MSAHLPAPILFPNVEALLVGHFDDLLDIRVANAIPDPRPAEFLRIVRTGGPRTGVRTDSAQVTFEYWADTLYNASEGARLVRAHVNALAGRRIDGVQVNRVQEFSGPSELPDPSGQPRYSWTVQIDVRGTAI